MRERDEEEKPRRGEKDEGERGREREGGKRERKRIRDGSLPLHPTNLVLLSVL